MLGLGVQAQVTTSSMSGKITDESGAELIGATVLAIHTPSGTEYGVITRTDGKYNINNMNPGGPYVIMVNYLGYSEAKVENIYLNLGESSNFSFILTESSSQLQEVVVTGNKALNSSKTGSETIIDNNRINALPTISRSLGDFTRFTPQAKVDNNGAISIAGQNNRMNSISIDGALNNDVFGLAASGTNGGQSGISPISIDAIESFKVVISPFDVSLSGFTGGGINAITRSGTNSLTGSVYYFHRSQGLAGLTPTDVEGAVRTPLANFNAYTTGVRLGGPIIKDKLFFFVNAELQREERPRTYNVATYGGTSKQAEIDGLKKFVSETYNYNVGDYGNTFAQINSDKISARLDYNLNKSNKLTFSHRYTYGESISPSSSGSQSINFSNGGIYFPSTTNSTSLELKSTIGTNMSNSLLFGYTTVRDDRDPIGSDFPFVRIVDGTGVITFGSEAFSTGNQLNSDVFTVLNKFQLYKGNHNLMFGFDAELGSFYNLFIRQNYGQYQYGSVADFYADNPNRYDRSYSLVDNITGDGSKAAAEFNTSRFGLFVSDKYEFSDKFTITAGVRVDGNYFPSQPTVDQVALDYWNNVAKPVISANYELDGAEAGKMPTGKINISPRLGLNYDVNGDKKLQIRAGTGIFFGRIPMVWPGGAYSNSGAIIGGVGINRPTGGWNKVPVFSPDVNKQYDAGFFGQSVNIPNGELNLVANDFKLPSVLRSSLGIDKKFDNGWKISIEGMYSQNYNDIEYNNVNIAKPTLKAAGADNRSIYTPTGTNPVKLDFDADKTGVQNQYNNNVFLLKNATLNGNSWNVSAQIEKTFFDDLQTSFSYTYGESKILNEVTSSQNSSQWRYIESVNGRNAQTLSYSDFDLGHRIVGFASYALGTTSKTEGKKIGGTTISLFYTGQSGNRFSYVYANSIVNDWGRTEANDLIFVPAKQDQIVFKDAATANAQWADLDKYIKEDEYLNSRRGDYAERNGSRSPFQHSIDLKFIQDINLYLGKKTHTLQLTFDIFNFTNILNSKWGRQYFVNNDNFRLMTFEGFKDAPNADYTPTFSFKTPTSDPWTINDGAFNSSRWSGQFGIRYIFN